MARLPAALARGAGRYDVLLLLVVGVLLCAPFEGTVLRPVIEAALALVLLFALWTSEAHPRLVATACVVVVVGLAAVAVAQAIRGRSPHVVFSAVSVLLCAATIAAIVARLTSRLRVTARTLAASLSIYLLYGLLLAYVYSLIGALRDAGFFAQPGPHDSVSYLYFSYLTLTTVGYGDLTAATDTGRMLAVLEALSGQLYLVTVVAVVVSRRARPSG